MDTLEQRNIRTLASKKDLWESNIIENKPFIKKDIVHLWNDFKKIDGVLISASPNLSNTLYEIKEKSRISNTELVVVDIASKYLMDNQIKPNFIICCESSKEAIKFLDYNCDVPLICDVVTNPEIVKNWQGEKYFYVTNNPCIDLDNNKELFFERHKKLSGVSTVLTVGGNVGSAGLAFLLSIRNCRKVYLYGHEFCWKKDGDFYCGGIYNELAEKRIKTEKQSGTLYERTDINGDDVYTNMSLETFRDWYKDIILKYPNVIENRTGAGLLN